MASQLLSPGALRKRKRDYDGSDDNSDSLFVTQYAEDGSYANADAASDVGIKDEQGEGETAPDATVDDDSEDATYNERSEPFPSCAAYDARFAEIEDRLVELASGAKAVLDGQMCDTDAVDRLQALASDAATVPEPRREMIGLLGDTGAGKSSFTNSFTDIPNMAKALDAGQSCTYVVTLYTKASPSQKLDFSAEIEYFDLETIGRLLSDSLDDWQAWRFDADPTWSEDLKQQHQRRAMTCLSTFRAVFRTLDAFKTSQSAEKRLDAIVRKDIERAEEIKMFVTNAKKELDKKAQRDGKYFDYWEADTQGELRDITDPLLSEVSNYEEPTLWPLVKKVTWGVRGSRILDRFTVADMAGISDTNQVRVNATYEHIEQCNHVWCVSRAGRIVSDLVVDGLLGRYGVPFDGNVAVIATKSDENVDHELAQDMRRRGYDLGQYDQLKKAVLAVGKQLKDTKARKAKLSPRKTREKLQLQEEIEDHTEALQGLESQVFGLIVRARNTHIVGALQREKQQHLPKDKKLNAFAVSNLHYAAHKEVATVSGPALSTELTGIPEIRAFALNMAAPKVFRSLEDFINQNFSLFIRALELWANQQLAQGRGALLEMVKEPQTTVADLMSKYLGSLNILTEKGSVVPFQEHQARFVTHAMQAIDRLRDWHWSTLRAFVRNYGSHSTSVKPQQSWNYDFFEAAIKVIRAGWPEFRESHGALVKDMKTDIIKQVRTINKNLKKDASAVTLRHHTFDQALQANIDGLKIAFRAHLEAMTDGFRNILLRATTDQGGCYFRATIMQAYDTCQNDGGKGIKDRTLTCFRTHLSLAGDRSPFAILAKNIQSAVHQLAQDECTRLRAEIGRILGNIVTTFDLMISRKEFDPLEIPVRDAVKEFLVTGKPKFEEIRVDLAKLKQQLPSETAIKAFRTFSARDCEFQTDAAVLRCVSYGTIHFSLAGNKFPFTQNAESIAGAINGRAAEKGRVAKQSLKAILVGMYGTFVSTVAEEVADPAEQHMSAARKEFLDDCVPERSTRRAVWGMPPIPGELSALANLLVESVR
ncbi:hypothetical protein LTR36_000239 [Oleoguttula mirabilis]|uniref:DUF7605 domain-containing protein n=1 Tax=Oleoguttula mirabilis TaxID=1507867 RepID=A0AAV9JY71_9PEZI|nr:hypothetical protein LTR36_000239 [Oleoguttula mirabilis]